MRIVLQRVAKAVVRIDGAIAGSIGRGILLLVGVHNDDTPEAAGFLAAKCADLRIFSDDQDRMNLSLKQIGGQALVVSQFTLFGDCSRGRRPSFIAAAPPEKGRELYEYFIAKMKEQVGVVASGVFGAMMQVELINDGPVTIILEK
ncbi:MAG: D-tyrosyl-tRNA(Tyr) deacylase [Chitinispirillaceae bacterium]|nr:D-tyrosyl-tRNA(Tyr) deacylase [Chitinispirillaceae bacterium]